MKSQRMKKLLSISLLSLGFFIFTPIAKAQTSQPNPVPQPAPTTVAPASATPPSTATSPTVHEYRLKNNLRLIVKEDHRAPVVISEVWYKVGGSYEPDGITGISHALEHMMFRGSKNYPGGQFVKIISENGGQQNASTSEDYTNYYELISADKLPIAFALEADRMRNLTLGLEDYAKEIQVVMEERRMRIEDDPQMLTYERFLASAQISNPYHHMTIGWMDDLKHMTNQDLRNWYQTWYAPNNAILVVVGDVQPQQVYQEAEKYFGMLPSSQIPALKPRNEVKSLGTRTVEVEVPAELPWLIMGYNTPVLNTADEKWKPYALLVIGAILNGGDSSRLQKDVVRDSQIAASVDVNYSPFDRVDNLFIIDGTPAQGHTIDQLKTAFLQQIQRLQTQPVTEQELSRIKAQVIAGRVYQKDSITNQANEIGSLEAVGLSWREGDESIKKISAITPAQIQAAAKEFLTPQRLTIGTLKPLPLTGKEPPAQPHSVGDSNVH